MEQPYFFFSGCMEVGNLLIEHELSSVNAAGFDLMTPLHVSLFAGIMRKIV